MRQQRKRILISALATAMVGCAALGGTPPRAVANAQVTIEVWDWHYATQTAGDLGTAMRQLDAAFMRQYPSIRIKHVGQPFNSYFTLERAAIASKRGPDVLMNYSSPALFDFYQGLLPLTSYVTPEQRRTLTGWALASTGLSDKGTIYAVPWVSQGIVLYYNKALFRKAGLDAQRPPQTWAELLKDCAALKAAGVVPIVSGFKDGYYGEWWLATLPTQFMSAAELSSNLAKPNWTSPANAKGMGFVTDLVKRGYMTPNAEGIALFPDAVNAFGAGKGAMFLGLAANNANWTHFKPTLGADLGAMLMPVLPGSLYARPRFDISPGEAWSITRWSVHPKEAYTYISFLTQAGNQESRYAIAGSLPNNLLAKPRATYGPAAQILGWARDARDSYVSPSDEIRPNPEATFDKLITQVVAGQLSLSDALSQVQSTQDQTQPLPGT